MKWTQCEPKANWTRNGNIDEKENKNENEKDERCP